MDQGLARGSFSAGGPDRSSEPCTGTQLRVGKLCEAGTMMQNPYVPRTHFWGTRHLVKWNLNLNFSSQSQQVPEMKGGGGEGCINSRVLRWKVLKLMGKNKGQARTDAEAESRVWVAELSG